MKFVINTNYRESAGAVVLNGLEKRLLESGYDVVNNDWEHYTKYSVAIFMAPDSRVREAKKMNPKLLCIIFDPKISKSWQLEENKMADLLIVSSIEQRDYLLKYNKNIFIYYMFPDTPEIKKEHVQKGKIIIGYHGNKQHLDAMQDVAWALDEISKSHDIEFWAIYNINKLGKWRRNVPNVCPVKHIQWTEQEVINSLKQCDIGVVPSVVPASSFFSRPFRSFFYNPEGYHNNDYVQRFKFSNNPGRIYVFSQLHIPVVADFTPSACQIIKNRESGFLVGTKEGWHEALNTLVNNAIMRNNISENMKRNVDIDFSIKKSFQELMFFIKNKFEI